MKNRTRGFTLIELMIVVVVVAILAAIALPSYTRQVQKSRRAQAKADLTELAQQLERQYTVNRNYTGYTLGFTTSPRDPGAVVGYNLRGAIAAGAYVLTAAATGPQATDLCGNLTLDNLGVKQHSTGTDTDCTWGTTGGP